MDPNSHQVGGRHYKTEDGYEHWDFVADYNLGYFEGQITKYLTRWQKKSGAEDVAKAIHYFDKLLSLYASGRKRPAVQRTTFDTFYLQKFLAGNQLGEREQAVFIALLRYESPSQLASVRPVLEELLKDAIQRKGKASSIEYCSHGYANKGNCPVCRTIKPRLTDSA